MVGFLLEFVFFTGAIVWLQGRHIDVKLNLRLNVGLFAELKVTVEG